ncbi:hypothetical protein MRX96_020293 [Rhipicephalus microplus]
MPASVCSAQDDAESGLVDAPLQVGAASCLRVCQNCQRPSLSVAEGESERDGSFFSLGDVVAPHGSAGTFCECVVHGYSLIVCMVVVGGVNIVRSILVCIGSPEGFHSGFPPALM